MNVTDLDARRHDPPSGWPADAFARLTDALAAALVASYRRRDDEAQPEPAEVGRS